MIKRAIPDELVPMLNDFALQLRSELSHLVIGLYLQGSIALGGFERGKSDIDFIAVVNRNNPTDEDIAKMIAIHERLKEGHPQYLMAEGQYSSVEHLSKTCATSNERFPKFFYGQDQGLRSGYIDPTSAWILKHHGIAVFGPDAEALEIAVDWDNIRHAMDYNLNVYWAEKARHEELFLDDEWIEFAVLTLGRILYTLQHRQMITKSEAGQYLLRELPATWHALVREALRIRRDEGETMAATPTERARLVRRFIRDITERCNEYDHIPRNDHDSRR